MNKSPSCPWYYCGCDHCRDLRAWADKHHHLDMRSVEPYKRPFILAAREKVPGTRTEDYEPDGDTGNDIVVQELEDAR